MASQKVSINNFNDILIQELQDYGLSCTNDVKKVTDEVTKDFVEDTKRDANKGQRKKYHKNISSKTVFEDANAKFNVWHVKDPEYRLTHLLVKGHATRNGGRTEANDFLSGNIDKLERNFEKGIEEAVKNGH